MEFAEFETKVSELDARMKDNLQQYQQILKDVSDVERQFCSCGFISEWLERSNRESIEELYTFLNTKKDERSKDHRELPSGK